MILLAGYLKVGEAFTDVEIVSPFAQLDIPQIGQVKIGRPLLS